MNYGRQVRYFTPLWYVVPECGGLWALIAGVRVNKWALSCGVLTSICSKSNCPTPVLSECTFEYWEFMSSPEISWGARKLCHLIVLKIIDLSKVYWCIEIYWFEFPRWHITVYYSLWDKILLKFKRYFDYDN